MSRKERVVDEISNAMTYNMHLGLENKAGGGTDGGVGQITGEGITVESIEIFGCFRLFLK